jgi:ABC-type amino acid transport substrate-binding protein
VLALILLMSCMGMPPSAATTAQTHVEIITGEWSPYVSAFNGWPGATHGQAFGLATEILALTLRQCRVDADFSFMAWSDVLPAADNRSALAFPFRYSKQRAEKFAFSEPLLFSREYLFFNPNVAPELAEAANIVASTGTRLVFVKGYEYAPEFSALRKSGALEVDDERQAFEMIITGNADALIADERVGDYLLQTFFPDRGRLIERNEKIAATTGLSLLFPKPLTEPRRRLLACIDDRLDYLGRHSAQERLAVMMGLDGDPGFDVVLDGPSEYPVAVGTEAVDNEEGYFIPRGTRALVLSWDDAFVSRHKIGDRQLMYRKTQVKLLDGPLRGRVLWVPNLFLRY